MSGAGPSLPRVGSDETISALGRLGFEWPRTKLGKKQKASGTHITLRKAGEPPRRATVVLAKQEIPAGTLQSILDQGGVSVSAFLLALRGSYARAERKRLRNEGRRVGEALPATD